MTESTIDLKELAYYERLADTWWDREGPFWPLHKLNEVRTGYLREHLCRHFGRDPRAARPLDGLRILDVGCGGGILSESVACLGAHVTGIDVVERNVQVALLHARDSGLDIDYRLHSVETLPDAGEARYDVVLNMEVVEHVANLPLFLDAGTALIAPGGAMAVATINRNVLSWLVAIVGAEYVFRLLPRGTHRWRKFCKPREIESLLEGAGLQVFASSGVRVNPLARSIGLTPFMGVNYMLLAARNRAK
ncbi:MAG: bifunctional 2-polyprenyl-6-hydroxyphenol methylase/3-demethylubiquinol 3-O-methyltransferase UbiG [Pseudomonadota bacterium]|nr:MAG: bifunctional 2-polyprenyl-6-hydroxyphenol methylase/3-demethylubiquinol 3-O-methyltransferase UbiG [Pseudomonadota bacterium]